MSGTHSSSRRSLTTSNIEYSYCLPGQAPVQVPVNDETHSAFNAAEYHGLVRLDGELKEVLEVHRAVRGTVLQRQLELA